MDTADTADTARTRYLGAKPPKPVGAALPARSDPIEIAAALVDGYVTAHPADFELHEPPAATVERPQVVQSAPVTEVWVRPAPPPAPRVEPEPEPTPAVLRARAARAHPVQVVADEPFDELRQADFDIRTALPIIERRDPDLATRIRALLDGTKVVDDDDGEE